MATIHDMSIQDAITATPISENNANILLNRIHNDQWPYDGYYFHTHSRNLMYLIYETDENQEGEMEISRLIDHISIPIY